MKNYNHNAESVEKAIGIEPNEIIDKALNLVDEDISSSLYIERLEKNFLKRELALLGSMFIHTLLRKANENVIEPSSDEEIKIFRIDKKSIPEKFRKYLEDKGSGRIPSDKFPPELLKIMKENSEEIITEENLEEKKLTQFFKGEGGEC